MANQIESAHRDLCSAVPAIASPHCLVRDRMNSVLSKRRPAFTPGDPVDFFGKVAAVCLFGSSISTVKADNGGKESVSSQGSRSALAASFVANRHLPAGYRIRDSPVASLRHATTTRSNSINRATVARLCLSRLARGALFTGALLASNSAVFAQFPVESPNPNNGQYPAYNPYPTYGQPSAYGQQSGYGQMPNGYQQWPAPQTMSGGYPVANSASTAAPHSQAASQSDDQLFAIAHLLEQQGRSAQAQRIYSELAKRYPGNPSGPVTGSAPGPGAYANGPLQPQQMQSQQTQGMASWPTAPQMQVSGGPPLPQGSQAPVQFVYASPPGAAAWPTAAGQPNPNQPTEAEHIQQTTPYAPLHPTDSLDPASQASSPTPADTSVAQSIVVESRGSTDSAPSQSQFERAQSQSEGAQSERGWHAAVTPLPAALAAANQQSPSVSQDRSISTLVPQGRSVAVHETERRPPAAVTEALSLPPAATALTAPAKASLRVDQHTDIEAIEHELSSSSSSFVPRKSEGSTIPSPQKASPDTPPPFVPSDAEIAERCAPVPFHHDSMPAAASPTPWDAAPPKDFNAERKLAAELARETEEIRIIPNPRGNRGQSASSRTMDGTDQSTRPSGNDAAANHWKTHVSSTVDETTGVSVGSDSGPRRLATPTRALSPESSTPRSVVPRQLATDAFASEEPVASERRDGDSKSVGTAQAVSRSPAFNLAACLNDPDFREIHTPAVFQGLSLLAQPEASHRALGAMRIGAAGSNARTAMPVLRKLLKVEPDKTVRIRVAEAMLKVQPGDLEAANCLAELLADRDNWQVRQTAACRPVCRSRRP